MTTDRFRIVDGRPTVQIERRYPHPIEKVWRAVTEPEHLGQWFPSPVEVDLRPGGKMRFSAFAEDPDSATGRVELVEAPRRLTFMWGTDRLAFELTSDGDVTTLTLIHSFDDRYGAPSFATGWEMCLAGLRSVLAGEPMPAPDRGIARHEELVHEFGLDQPEMSGTDEQWTVRFERQLTCPAEVARDLWFGEDQTTGEHITVEFADGTGHGARFILTITGKGAADRDEAIGIWGTGAVGHLANSAAEWALAQQVRT